ncbi:MAG TPA: serine hydrolase [Candidatus Saccharimonadales bacterium]|nr:serine hydrolase [Candidatus Saccharimonadales bacterium]
MIHKKQTADLWYTRLKPSKRALVIIGAVFVLFVVGAQLLYPQGKGLPFASVAGKSVRLATHDEMTKAVVDAFAASRVKLTVGKDISVEFDLKQAGAEPNTETMVARLSDYPLWQRFIPGSIFWQPSAVTLADVYFTNKPFKDFIETKAKELSFPPQNARLAIKDGRLTANEAVEGSDVTWSALLDTVSRAQITLGTTTTIEAPSKRLKAERYSKDLASVQKDAEAALGHNVSLTAGSKTFTPSKNEIASWILLDDNGGKVTLSVDKEKIKAYLTTINKEVGVPAGQTNISIVDGRETGRVTGETGRAIDIQSVADQLAMKILVPPATIALSAPFVDVLPSVIFNSKYTTSEAGLRAYVADVAATKNIRISIQQIDGPRWSAAARANESTPSGSTYKLYVALVLFDKMDKGEIHWDDPMLDTTVAGCFERMTVASTNPCAEAWIAQFGRQYINDFVHARGFSSSTTFTANDANRSTAADLTKYMTGLFDSSLLSGVHRDRLLDSLGRHPYRYGIPTGSQGVVHDKVGFLWDYIHDTAIVQHPKGTYIMTVMTKGYSYATIAAITREVERIMYP